MKEKVYTKDIIFILIASFFYMASPMLVTPLITGFSEKIGVSGTVMGLIGGLMNLCSLVCRPLVGNMADRISKYKLSFIGSAFMILACLGYVFAFNPVLIIVSRIINGIGFSCCSVCMSTWMSNLLPRNKIGSGMGLYGTMNALSMAVAPAIGVSVYQLLGYRAAFIIALTFSVCIMVVIQFVHDKGEPTKPIGQGLDETKKQVQIVDTKVIPISIVIMLFAIPYCATQSFLVRYTETRNMAVTVSLFFPSYALILLILRLSLKSLFDKLPFRTFLSVSLCSAFVAMLLLYLMHNNIIMFLAATFMAGGYGIMSSVCQSTAILLAGPEKRGLANSTYYVGLDLGMSLGPILGGILYGRLPIHLFYPILMITIPICIMVYFICLRKMKLSGE